jgi:LmbE family N-acetylglucosaminyl deacetylase
MKAAEVLNGGGQIAVFRSEAQLPTELAEAFAEVYDRVLPDLLLNPHRPRRQGHAPTRTLSEEAVHGLRQTGRFEAEDVWTVEWQRPYTREQWLDELPTSGLLTRVRPPALAELLTGIGAAIDATTGGSFIVPYTTVAVTARRKI